MAAPCARRNPLVRSGLTQGGRRRAELQADHFLPDERDLADLILFGQRFAKYIQYYDDSNIRIQGNNWAAFFESDVAASLAALAKLPVDAFRGFQLDLENWLRADPERDPAELSAHAALVFHLPVVLLQMAGSHHARLPAGHPLISSAVGLVARELAEPIVGLISWYQGATNVPGAGNEVFKDVALDMSQFNVTGAANDRRVRLSRTIASALDGQPTLSAAPVPDAILRGLPQLSWASLYTETEADSSPYLDAIGAAHQRYEQIYDALSYNLLSASIEKIYQGLERLRRDALSHLNISLASFAEHPPHYGLWLAFLQLFEHAKGRLNEFTGRHLEFYFREVLRLGNRAATPDRVHLLFELAKGRETHLLPAGTLFRAGKDNLGRPVSYALDNDIVINRATIAEMRGLQIETGGTPSARTQTPRAAFVARSRDGLGEVDLPKDDPTWPLFGPTASPTARVGFAIADRKLFLREGVRIVHVMVELTLPVADVSIAPRWIVRLTGGKDWFEVPRSSVTTEVLNVPAGAPDAQDDGSSGKKKTKEKKVKAGPAKAFLGIEIRLGANDPPVVPFDRKLHAGDHEAGVPVIEVAFDFSDTDGARAFAVLRDIKARRVSLRSLAGGLKNLMAVAGGATADVAKPFAPFGAQPRAGAFLVIGSSEIFSKSIEALYLTIDWETPYSSQGFYQTYSADAFDPTEAVLAKGRWHPVAAIPRARGEERPTFIATDDRTVAVEIKGASLIDGLTEQTIENPPLDTSSINGFVRLRLPFDFGHAAFGTENARALIALANKSTYTPSTGVNTHTPAGSGSPIMPNTPYDPVITRLEATYFTKIEPVEHFKLLHPFGASGDGQGEGRLFPDFPFEGALLIGVKDFDPPARLTLLVQVADGSGDPLKQAPTLEFSFLRGDTWTAFDSQDIDDKTRNFSGSGVLGLSVPEEADTAHRVLPTGLHWIRVAAARDGDALNRLLSIDAQAARASFADAGNEPAFLNTPLPAGTISKLATPDLALKKIVQPYSSFDGRPAETSAAFSTRVSERLRHKDRAVTMFDYESLVLEAFPRLYRVKCLNTTQLKRNGQNTIVADNELMPGAVTVVTVPWTHGQNARDPLRPYTDQATLTAVDGFLRKRISPFVRLEVQNPSFEEVQVDFQVRFKPEVGDIAFYIDELNKALVGFLTPWSRPGGGEITFGGRLWKSSVIDFVEEQPQVEYIAEFRLYHKVDISAAAGAWTPVDVEMIDATTARSILVSAARHIIVEVPGNG